MNRIWAMMGRGIVHPVDAMTPSPGTGFALTWRSALPKTDDLAEFIGFVI